MPKRGITIVPAAGFEYPEGYQGLYVGVGPERKQVIGDCGQTDPVNPNAFNPSKMLSTMGRYFQTLHGLDRNVLSTLLESLAHAATNEYEQLDQINDSKDVNTVPTFIGKRWVQRDLTDGRYSAVPHAHLDFEYVAAGGETTVNLPAGEYVGDDLQLLYINRIGVDPVASGVTVGHTATNSVLTFPLALLPGDVIRLHTFRAQGQPTFTATGTQIEFVIDPPIDIVTAKVFINNINLEEEVGWTLRKRELVFTGGLVGGEVIRVQVGSQVTTVIGSAGQTRVPLTFTVEDPVSAKVTMDGINLRDGWFLEPTRLVFSKPPKAGSIVKIIGDTVQHHNHLSYSLLTAAAVDFIQLPAGIEFDINDDKTYNRTRPIYIWLDRQLLRTTEYTFLSRSFIKLAAPIPAGTQIEVRWTTRDDPEFHGHPFSRTELTGIGVSVFAAPGELDINRPEYVEVDGLLMSEDVDYVVTGDPGAAIKFTAPIGATSKVVIYGQDRSYLWTFDKDTGSPWDREIVDMEAIQNGIDHPSFVGVKDVDWAIPARGVLQTNFLIQDGWLKNAEIDEETAYNNFGILLGPQEETTDEYADLVRALMAAYTAGPKYYVKENFGRIVLGSAFARKRGRVKSIEVISV